MDAEWGGVGPPEVTMTAGELGVDELQLDVLELESCKNKNFRTYDLHIYVKEEFRSQP